MRSKKLAVVSLFAVSAVILSACSGSSGLTLDVPDVPMVEEVGEGGRGKWGRRRWGGGAARGWVSSDAGWRRG